MASSASAAHTAAMELGLYFATNRDPNNPDAPTDFGTRFSASGLTDLRFGSAEVTGAKLDKYVLDVAPEKLDVGLDKAVV